MAMPIPVKYVAKIMISRHAIKAFIKCLKQPGFLFRMNNYTFLLTFFKFSNRSYFYLLLFIFFISTQTQNNAVYHLLKACSDFGIFFGRSSLLVTLIMTADKLSLWRKSIQEVNLPASYL